MCMLTFVYAYVHAQAARRGAAIDEGVALLDFGANLPAADPAGWDQPRCVYFCVHMHFSVCM